MPLDPGFVINDKFRVIRLLGAGGLGEVYEVEHQRTRHRRALKLLLPQWRTNREIVDRFFREASAAGHIGNPHIIETYDADTLPDGSPYIVMEFLSGQPLNEVLRWEGRLQTAFACEVLVQVCHAMDAAHKANIIHRDLKPDNLYLTRREGKTFVKVLDFGISKFSTEQTGGLRVTGTEVGLGTPLYMAPEQMRRARDVDARADIYSLGVILYEALAGAVPYSAGSFAELAGLVLAGGAKRLDALDPAIPAELASAVQRCIAVDPDRRFESAGQVRDVLQAWARDEAPPAVSDAGLAHQTLATPAPVRAEEIARTSQRTSHPPEAAPATARGLSRPDGLRAPPALAVAARSTQTDASETPPNGSGFAPRGATGEVRFAPASGPASRNSQPDAAHPEQAGPSSAGAGSALGETHDSLVALRGSRRRWPLALGAAVALGGAAVALVFWNARGPDSTVTETSAKGAAPGNEQAQVAALPAVAEHLEGPTTAEPVVEAPTKVRAPTLEATPSAIPLSAVGKPAVTAKKHLEVKPASSHLAPSPTVREAAPPEPPRAPEPSIELTPPPMPAVDAPPSSFTLRLGCVPDVCRVTLDGADQHRETPASLKVSAGAHRVTLTNLRTGEERIEDVVVTSDGRARAVVDFRK